MRFPERQQDRSQESCCSRQPKVAVNLDKPLNSNRKPFFGSRFWIRSRTCQNGFFTLRIYAADKTPATRYACTDGTRGIALSAAFPSSTNQALLPLFLRPSAAHACTKKGFISGSRSLLHLQQYLYALTKRHFSSLHYRGSDAPAQTAE
ncbi:hypothetical protein [Herbaspirillum lusitanum]|uniref:hypothetical protein n=1 Tax=Herbaspirillum lusitanum TaxID=213312 RepID=UPI002237E91E|nr:hypothetical protein [Herbaspirillum lusitanum]